MKEYLVKMETLSNYSWDTRYSSATHDLIKDFFVPALSKSRFYYRIAGFFSSTAIAAAFRGISSFIENGEKMFLIIGGDLSKEDANAINKGVMNMDSYLHKRWEECAKDFENNTIKKRFELLSWLIANEKLEIRIGVNVDKNGKYLPTKTSLFHEKILIFEDYNGNQIQVDGSINETWKAWKTNRESFCVHKSWIQDQQEFIRTAKKEFDEIWSNSDSTCRALTLPEAIKKDMLSFRPKNRPRLVDEVDFNQDELEQLVATEEKTPRRYQKEAIAAWKSHNHKGVLEMATGTGKTFTALRAIKELDLNSKFLVIGVPQTELATQWANECDSIFSDVNKRIVVCYGTTDWKRNLSREIRQTKRENSLCILISVFNTLRSEKFLKEIQPILNDTYLIIDEVHEIGSYQNRKVLKKLEEVQYRLGLSATPHRAWDNEGNKAIQDFFCEKEPVFKWDLKKAITPPKGYEQCLCPYYYHIHECNLNKKELEEYTTFSIEIGRKVAILLSKGKKIANISNEPSLKFLLLKRATLIKKCQDKLRVLGDILDKNAKTLNKCIIYCNDKTHMDAVTKVVLEKGYNCRKFFGEMDIEERERVFSSFKNDGVKFLIAIKCLDQGIDLPICDSAIILTSSTNPREYVQRRGRILRLHDDKEFAIVHDLIVFPEPFEDLKAGKVKLYDYEARLLDNQLKRMSLFMENCINRPENVLKRMNYGDIILTSLEKKNE